MPSTFAGWPIAKAHGASYHLLQLATQAALGATILGIEVNREVPVFKSAGAAKALGAAVKWKGTARYIRRVDIVTGTNLHTDETWWELKSWRSVSKTNRKPKQNLATWTFLKGQKDSEGNEVLQIVGADEEAEASGEPHKQFCLDRIASKHGGFIPKAELKAKGIRVNGDDIPPNIIVGNAYWAFHKFTAGKNRDIVNPTATTLSEVLTKDPKGDVAAFKAQAIRKSTAESRINLGEAKQLMDIIKERGYDLALEALEELPETLD